MKNSLINAGILVTRDNERARVILPMRSPYTPVPLWLAGADLIGIVLIPLWAIGAFIIRTVLRIPAPPRGVFEIDATRFRMTLVSQRTGEQSHFECDRVGIVELRKNRYDKGLYLHVRGIAMETYLQDLEDDTILSLSATLRQLLGRDDGERPIDPSKYAEDHSINSEGQ